MNRETKPLVPSARLGMLALAALVCVLSMTACNTTQGAGEDIENLGEGIQDAAQDAK